MPRLLENYALTKRPKGRADAFSQASSKKTNRSPLPVGSRLVSLHRSAGKVLVKLFQKLAGLEGAAPLLGCRNSRNPLAQAIARVTNCRFTGIWCAICPRRHAAASPSLGVRGASGEYSMYKNRRAPALQRPEPDKRRF